MDVYGPMGDVKSESGIQQEATSTPFSSVIFDTAPTIKVVMRHIIQ